MIGRQMVADNCETVWTIVVVEVLAVKSVFVWGIHYLMYFLGRLNVIESSTCAVCKRIVARQWNFDGVVLKAAVRLY
jgi:hypothetical protein